jgi:two-component sensor histidine kinase/CHASE2 domain-containing sensor protein
VFANRTPILIFVVALLCAAGWWSVHRVDSGLFHFESAAHDYIARHGRLVPANPKLRFLAIDNDSIGIDAKTDLDSLFGIQPGQNLESRALGLMSEHWPWPRNVYALILDRLLGAGAKVVVFDLNFPTPGPDDESFRSALDRYRDHVVLGSNFVPSPEGTVGGTLTLPTPTLIPQTEVSDSRVGFVNFWTDPDGLVRETRFRLNFGQFVRMNAPGENDYLSLAAQAVAKYGQPQLIPSDHQSRLYRMTGEPGRGFPARSIFEIFVPEYWERNYHSGADFKDSIVVVGAAGNWQHDEHETAFGLTPGPEIQLNVINALLHGEFVRPVSWPVQLLLWLVAALGALVCCVYTRSPIVRLAIIALGAAVWFGFQLWLYNRAGLLVPIAGPVAVLVGAVLFSIVYDLVRSASEQIQLRRNLAEQKRAEELLQASNAELERRVSERTAELSKANATLTDLVDEKNVLIKEIHHRVKNNLQIISSLLNLQANYIEDPVALHFFHESRSRVRSMALIHEKLYQSNDLAKVDFQDYLKTLTSGLQASFSGRSHPVQLRVEVDSIMLGVDSAVPCGLIVNELVTNCFKYAFAERAGEIRVAMKRLPESRLELTVSDDGVGFPKDLDFRNTESLGMQLVTALTDQLEVNVELRNGTGTTFEITFPEKNEVKS